jgi:hypothetical protein
VPPEHVVEPGLASHQLLAMLCFNGGMGQEEERRRSTSSVVGSFLALTWTLWLLRQLVLTEEEEEDPGEPGSHSRGSAPGQQELQGALKEYVDDLDGRIERYSRNARRRLKRYRLSVLASTALALGVPIAVAADSPGWIVAALGSGAAFIQVVLQVTQDYRSGTEQHVAGVQLSSCLRRFTTTALLDGPPTKVSVREFIAEVEQIEGSLAKEVAAVMRQEPTGSK